VTQQCSPVPADVPPPQSPLDPGDVGFVQAAAARMARVMVTRAISGDMALLRWVSGLTASGANSNGRDACAARICRQRHGLAISGISIGRLMAAVRPPTHGVLGRAHLLAAEP
jgi:hypothetical protein